VETFCVKSVALGNAYYLRRLLYEGLGKVTQIRLPDVYGIAEMLHRQYPSNIFDNPAFVAVDNLAMESGLSLSICDPALRACLKPVAKANPDLWQYIPAMYAASLTSHVWQEAVYRPQIEGHLNNAHVLAAAINLTVVILLALGGGEEDESKIIQALQQHVDMAAVIVLRMPSNPESGKKYVSLSSVIMFLDLFIKESPFATRDMLERQMPYSLLRAVYRELYSDPVLTK